MIHTSSWMAVALAAIALAGCRQSTETAGPATAPAPAPTPAQAPVGEGHTHGSGPNGGAVADWGGGEYHVEFTVNHDTQEATVYVLGSDAKTPAPIEAQTLLLSVTEPVFQVELAPVPLEGEAEEKSSRFVGKHEKLGIVQEFSGTISGEAGGKPYAGDFREMP